MTKLQKAYCCIKFYSQCLSNCQLTKTLTRQTLYRVEPQWKYKELAIEIIEKKKVTKTIYHSSTNTKVMQAFKALMKVNVTLRKREKNTKWSNL